MVYSKAAVYTCKPLLYKKKFERKVLPPQCPAKLWEGTVVNLELMRHDPLKLEYSDFWFF